MVLTLAATLGSSPAAAAAAPIPATPAPASIAPFAAVAPTRIMPLGDSITEGIGSSTDSSYRAELWRRLVDVDGFGVDFVGSLRHGQLPDVDHEGHSGWTIAQIAAQIDGWLATSRPDVVLLHIGTNDMRTAATAAGAPQRLSALIDRIRVDLPATTVFVAQIVPSTEAGTNGRVVTFNAAIPGIVAASNSTRVRLVNMFGAVNSATDFADSLHPNDSGYAKMAATWEAAVAPVLPAGRITGLGGKCIDTGATSVNGAPIQLWTCHGGPAQRWTVQAGTLRNRGRCMEVPGGATANGTQLQLWACTGGANQAWQWRPDGTIFNPASGRCVDVPFGQATDGNRLIIWDCKASANQVWT
ncbi:MAG: hypothetical protein QOE03_2381 [Micromonosporaceae bacterium]|nr:hypothetical protein [Micromonosporaceae bacterium]